MRKLDVGEWIVYEVRSIQSKSFSLEIIYLRSLQDMGASRALSSTFNYSPTPIYVISECLWCGIVMTMGRSHFYGLKKLIQSANNMILFYFVRNHLAVKGSNNRED